MKILKQTNIDRIYSVLEVFDTENINFRAELSSDPHQKQDLNECHNTSDVAFLRQYFPEGHQIFSKFCDAFYYRIN